MLKKSLVPECKADSAFSNLPLLQGSFVNAIQAVTGTTPTLAWYPQRSPHLLGPYHR